MFTKQEKTYKTKGFMDIIDITDDVIEFLKNNKVVNGLVNVFTRHTTAVLKINESESWLREDLKIWVKWHTPVDFPYHHNDLVNRDPKTMCDSKYECLNWHSHIASMLLWVSSETIPVENWKMLFWRRQRLLLIETDHSRDRTLVFSFMGE